MEMIKATVKGGKVVPESPVDWHDGLRVLMEPEPPGLAYEREHGHEPPEGWKVPDWNWTAAFGTYHDGHACPDERVDWPDGWRVDVEARPNDRSPSGQRENEWDDSPEGVASRLALMDASEPLEMTEEEIARWEADRKARKEYEFSKWEERSRKIEELFP